MKYKNRRTTLDVKIVETEEYIELMDLTNRTPHDVGELFASPYISQLVRNKFGDNMPDSVTLVVTQEYDLLD